MSNKKFKCHNCGATKELPSDIDIWGCLNCGCVNDVPKVQDSGDEACTCLAPPMWAGWHKPAGVREGAGGDVEYMTGTGTWLPEDKYVEQLGLNPRIVLEAMRKLGEEGKPGFFNCSTLGKRRPQ